jgi:hypothetical protein
MLLIAKVNITHKAILRQVPILLEQPLSASSKSRLFSTIAYAYDAAFFQNASEGEYRPKKE